MAKTFHISLHQPSMNAAVVVAASHPGAPVPDGVEAWFWSDGVTHMGLIADAPSNQGVSATNGFEHYAKSLMAHVGAKGLDIACIAWFELDSTAMFDRVSLKGECASFAPIQHPGSPPRSVEAFMACVGELAPESFRFWSEVIACLNCTQAARAGL